MEFAKTKNHYGKWYAAGQGSRRANVAVRGAVFLFAARRLRSTPDPALNHCMRAYPNIHLRKDGGR